MSTNRTEIQLLILKTVQVGMEEHKLWCCQACTRRVDYRDKLAGGTKTQDILELQLDSVSTNI